MWRPRRIPRAACSTHRASRGITVIEILVAAGILGLLLALVLPAVQQSRMAAMRVECSNHLRQIGLAGQHYHDAYGFLPGYQMLYRLFPYLGLRDWFDAGASDRDFGKWHPILLCPVDRLHDPVESSGPYSYLVAGGSCLHCGEGIFQSGPAMDRGVSWNEVSDGLSSTAFFSERRASLHFPVFPTTDEAEIAACQADPVRCVWHLKSVFGPEQDADYIAACRDPQQRFDPHPARHDGRKYWSSTSLGYEHLLPPNTPSGYRGYPFETSYWKAASSHHAGGVNLLLCDGAVRFVSDTIHVPVWWALGTRSGNDVVGDD